MHAYTYKHTYKHKILSYSCIHTYTHTRMHTRSHGIFILATYIHVCTHTDAAGWKSAGNEFFSNKLFSEAITSYSSGLSSLNEQQPTFVPLLLNMAAACMKMNEPREALAWSLAAVQICPLHVKAVYRALAALQAIFEGDHL